LVQLTEVPIVGGTPDQVEAVRAEMAFMQRALVDAPVVRKVVFTELDDAAGTFRPRRSTIRIHEGARTRDVPLIVRHEVCHAVDHSFGGMKTVGEAALAAQSGMFGGTAGFGLEGESRDLYAREVFATMCAWGPAGLAAATMVCAGDRTGHEDVAAEVLAIAYGASSPPAEDDFRLRLTGDVVPEPDDVRVFDGGTLGFDYDGEPSIYVDVASLELVDGPEGALIPRVHFDAATLPIDGHRFSTAMREDGGGLAMVLPSTLEQPRLVGRRSEDDPWQPLRCTARTFAPPERPFVGPDGGLWLGSGFDDDHQVEEWVPAGP